MPNGSSNPYPTTPNRGPVLPSDFAAWIQGLEDRVVRLEALYSFRTSNSKPASDPHYRWDGRTNPEPENG